MLCQTNTIKHLQHQLQQPQLLHLRLHRHAAKADPVVDTAGTGAVVVAAKAVPAEEADVVKAVRVVPAAQVAVLEEGRAASANSSAKRKSASSVSKKSI